jgi:hypothetical protein
MTHVSSLDYLIAEVSKRLAGEERRVAELFETRETFEHLQSLGRDSDWYHFMPKTFDGGYLVEVGDRFDAYYQERGAIGQRHSFPSLRAAADYFFSANGYVRS